MGKAMPSDELNLRSGNLYSPFPIPAYQVLGAAKEYNAQRVLVALVSHMGKNNRCVWPSYTRIMKVSGVRNRSTVSKALTTLVVYGFIKVSHYREGKKERSKYYLQGSCWNSSYMNYQARQYRRANAKCLACLVYLDRGEYAVSGDSRIHYGCGGFVMLVLERDMPRKQIPWRDRIGGEECDSPEE
jgi:Helix-turn-helix domain